MRSLPPSLSASLASGATTLASCWIIERTDGVRLGFTDHDEDLTIQGVTCAAETGASATAIEQSVGLSVEGLEVMGALQDGRLTERELARGRFDGARIEVWRVDWSHPASRVLMMAGHVGEISRGRTGFVGEVRSLSAALNQARGRLYQRSCDAQLGDARCGVNAGSAAYRATGRAQEVLSSRALRASGLQSFADGWFAGGLLRWISGANAGLAREVRSHIRLSRYTTATLDLWEPMPEPIAAGDDFTVTAGCSKTIEDCRRKFGNVTNFRGFPHLPGNDFVTSYAQPGPENDGGSSV